MLHTRDNKLAEVLCFASFTAYKCSTSCSSPLACLREINTQTCVTCARTAIWSRGESEAMRFVAWLGETQEEYISKAFTAGPSGLFLHLFHHFTLPFHPIPRLLSKFTSHYLTLIPSFHPNSFHPIQHTITLRYRCKLASLLSDHLSIMFTPSLILYFLFLIFC